MRKLASLEETNEVSAVRLVSKRQRAKVGDIFRLSPSEGIFIWGRLVKRSKFFGVNGEFNLVYIYDAIGPERPPPGALSPAKLIIGPSVVNNLGWSRGYWEIMASEPLQPEDQLDEHFFIRYRGTGSACDYDVVDEDGKIVRLPDLDLTKLSQSGFGNFNSIDWRLREILQARQLIE